MNHSLIFTKIDKEAEKATIQLGLFGKSFKDISRDFSSGHGVFASLFEQGLSQHDIDCITNFVKQTEKGIPIGRAWNTTMSHASVAGKKMAKQVKLGVVELDALTKSSTSSKLAMTGTTIAAALEAVLSMGLALAIQAVVTGLNYLVHLQENLYEKAKEQADASAESAKTHKEEADSLNELINKYKERMVK